MRNILEIYEQYKIMPNLAMHQLRVTSVARLIIDNLNKDIKIDDEKVITAALLHDMGNIIKFNLHTFPEFNEPFGLEYWQKIQNEYFEKYGKDEHTATVEIMKELNVRSDIIDMIRVMMFGALCKHSSLDTMLELKIMHYVDMRVGPYGILSYEDRMLDVRKRYANVANDEFTKFLEDERNQLLYCGKEIENQIFANCKIKPEDINDASIAPILEELKGYMVK